MDKETYKNELNKLKSLLLYDKRLFRMDEFTNKYHSLLDEVEYQETSKKPVDYTSFVIKINELIKELKKVYDPLYYVVLYSSSIKDILDNMDETNMNAISNQVIRLAKKIIPYLQSNNRDVISAVDDVCDVIYYALLRESMFEKTFIRDSLVSLRNHKIISFLTMRIDGDFIHYNHDDNISEYRLLDSDIIRQNALMKMKEVNDGYLERKRTATIELYCKYAQYDDEKEILDRDSKLRKENLKNFHLYLTKSRLKLMSYVLVPVMIMGGSSIAGGLLSKQYKDVIKTYDSNTKKLINVEESKDNGRHDLIIKVYDRWEVDSNTNSYSRFVTEYKYKGDKKIDESSIDEILDSIKYDNVYLEHSDIIPVEEENRKKIVITETVPVEHKGLDVGGMIAGLAAGALLSKLLFSEHFDDEKSKEYKEDINKYKNKLKGIVEWRVVKKRYANLKGKLVELEEEHKQVTDYYGVPKEIDYANIEEAKNYIYQNGRV